MLFDDPVTRTWDLSDGCHTDQTCEGDALCPYTGLDQFLGKRHGLGVDVGKDAAHAGSPGGGDDAKLVLLGPGERLVLGGERFPFLLFARLEFALQRRTCIRVVGLVESNSGLVGVDDTGYDGNRRD